MPLKFELYTRVGCHLCEEMEQEILILEKKLNFRTDVIIINDNSQLEQSYGDKVPVLAHGDNVICEYVINEEAISKVINQSILKDASE